MSQEVSTNSHARIEGALRKPASMCGSSMRSFKSSASASELQVCGRKDAAGATMALKADYVVSNMEVIPAMKKLLARRQVS